MTDREWAGARLSARVIMRTLGCIKMKEKDWYSSHLKKDTKKKKEKK